jgi:hypothetical protein
VPLRVYAPFPPNVGRGLRHAPQPIKLWRLYPWIARLFAGLLKLKGRFYGPLERRIQPACGRTAATRSCEGPMLIAEANSRAVQSVRNVRTKLTFAEALTTCLSGPTGPGGRPGRVGSLAPCTVGAPDRGGRRRRLAGCSRPRLWRFPSVIRPLPRGPSEPLRRCSPQDPSRSRRCSPVANLRSDR